MSFAERIGRLTSPITYPEGTISKYGTNQALLNQLSWISYIGVDGSIFYLAGPCAPVAGAQNGMVLVKHMGLMSPFELLKLQGARQDGETWTDTLYDAGEIMLSVEASGTTPQAIRDVIRQWISAWDPEVGNEGFPTQLGKLSVFTPDLGEWWANVRVAKNISDVFDQDYTYSGKQALTWEVHNEDAFWYGVDSTSSFGIDYDGETFDMSTESDASTLPVGWTQYYRVGGHGTYGISNGSGQWLSGSGSSDDVINIAPTTSTTDNQVSSIKYARPDLANLFNFNIPLGTNDAWVRLNTTPAGSYGAVTGVRLRIGLETFSLSCFVAGTEHHFFTLPLLAPPLWGEVFTLVAGTDNDDYEFAILRDGIKFFSFTDSGHHSVLGSAYRGWGFGAGTGFSSGVVTPPPLGKWVAQDNLSQTQSGFVPLTNMGDMEAWPRYLCYGPGTFSFGNGPSSTTSVTVGPLYDGQIVLVTTDPLLRSVVDLTPTAVKTPVSFLTKVEELVDALKSFATNYNAPPLLKQFESIFGLLPPQGNLYSTMVGRFTKPLPRAYYGKPLVTNYIPVSITDGGPNSKIVAAITPRRRWPL